MFILIEDACKQYFYQVKKGIVCWKTDKWLKPLNDFKYRPFCLNLSFICTIFLLVCFTKEVVMQQDVVII